MVSLHQKHSKRNGGPPSGVWLKEKLRYRRYWNVGLREAAKIADPDTRDYFLILFWRALHSEIQVIDLAALRKRAAELAAEGPPEPEPEPEPPAEAAPQASIPEAPGAMMQTRVDYNQYRPRGPPGAQRTASNEEVGL
jgi:hypothetical protein